jgi:hypothetical protein
MTPMKNTKAALSWIVDILNKKQIPYQITGGFAARLYGSDRALADLDFDIPEDRFADILPEVKQYVIFGPKQYKNDHWDLLVMTLEYEGQEIDIAGAYEGKLFDSAVGKWVLLPFDLSKAIPKEAFGMTVSVIPRDDLIEYKKKLGRAVDQEDVKNLVTG